MSERTHTPQPTTRPVRCADGHVTRYAYAVADDGAVVYLVPDEETGVPDWRDEPRCLALGCELNASPGPYEDTSGGVPFDTD